MRPVLFCSYLYGNDFLGVAFLISTKLLLIFFLIAELLLPVLFNCLLCSILNSTLFISNEKNSSLFTQLLGNCKDILISFSSLIILKDFKPTFKTIAGLIISTSGAILFSMKSLLESIIIGGGDEKSKKTQ